MNLPEFHMKHLLQEEIEFILGREFYFTVECCIRYYHIFKSFWETPVLSILIAKHEADPQSLIHDKFAIALVNGDLVTVGHNPKFMSKLIYSHGEYIKNEITGVKKYSKDWEQSGFENSVRLTIGNTNKRMTDAMKEKLNRFVEEYRKTNSKPKQF